MMTLHVHQVEGEFRVVLTAEQMALLHLADGDAIRLSAASEEDGGQAFEFISAAEALRAFDDTYADHEESYLELAK